MTKTKQQRRIIGTILIPISFLWAWYLDTLCNMGCQTNSFAGWMTYPGFLQDIVLLFPLVLGLGFLMWDTSLIQEDWF